MGLVSCLCNIIIFYLSGGAFTKDRDREREKEERKIEKDREREREREKEGESTILARRWGGPELL